MALFTVHIRRDHGKPIRPEAEQLEGSSYTFKKGWTMDKGDPYPGEVAWIPCDPSYPPDAPTWIASGDLQAEPESELRNNTLSPAAYAIIAAAHQQGHTNRRGLAAALRAAAEHIDDASDGLECQDILLQIADELENNDN